MNNMAAVLCKQGDYGLAIKWCEKALEVDPNHAMSHRNLAKILDTRGDTRSAVQHNRQAIQLGPGIRGITDHADTMAYRNLSRQLVARGMTEEGHACAHFDQYRALAKKVNVLPNSQTTAELLMKTKTIH
jgi:tetratricopeptide (TPR) repeat protein